MNCLEMKRLYACTRFSSIFGYSPICIKGNEANEVVNRLIMYLVFVFVGWDNFIASHRDKNWAGH